MDLVFMRLKWSMSPLQTEIWYGSVDALQFNRKRLEIGDEIHLRLTGRRYCIGSESARGRWITCLERQKQDGERNLQHAIQFIHPDEKNIDPPSSVVLVDSRKFQQCYRCSTTEYFTCRMTCVGDECVPSSDLAKQMCTPANTSVYITYVGDQIKAGVSLNYYRRWLEQGSDLAFRIASLPGLEARRLEQRIAQDLELKLQVRGQTKLNNLNSINTDRGAQELNETYKQSLPIVDEILTTCDGRKFEQAQMHDLSPHYGYFDPAIPINTIEATPGIEFGGTIRAIKGNIVIVQQNSYLYAMDFKQLVSQSFEFLDRPAKIPTQSFLDQWF